MTRIVARNILWVMAFCLGLIIGSQVVGLLQHGPLLMAQSYSQGLLLIDLDFGFVSPFYPPIFLYEVQPSPIGEPIFAYLDSNTADIVISDIAGTNRRPIMPDRYGDYEPRWSPSGRQLLFSSFTEQGGRIHIVDIETGQIQLLAQPEANNHMARWSPDGRQITFLSGSTLNNLNQLYVMDADGSHLHLLTLSNTIQTYSWSSTGNHIAFVDAPEQSNLRLLHIVNLATNTSRSISVDNLEINSLAWSPDDRWLIFMSSYSSRVSQIFRIHVDSNNFPLLITHTANDTLPQWSPDGSHIFFTCDNGDICVINPDGSNLQPLIAFAAVTARRWWLLDGRQIVFICDFYRLAGRGEVCVYDVDNGVTEQFTYEANASTVVNLFTWVP